MILEESATASKTQGASICKMTMSSQFLSRCISQSQITIFLKGHYNLYDYKISPDFSSTWR